MNPCYAPAIVFFFPFESPPVLFIFGCHGSSLPHGLFSSCGERGLLMVVASCAVEQGLQGTWAWQLWLRDSGAQAQALWCRGLFAPRHAGWSRIRVETRVSCTGRWIL